MDLAFLNSICKTTYFPPGDPWLSGFTINYYYLGYVLNSVIIKIVSLDVSIAYNLALSSTLAMVFITSWGFVYTFTGSHFGGISSSFLLAISGNNDGFLQIIKLQGLIGFNFFQSSRIIPNTINEFPFFSFILGDLHPHYTSLPIFIFALTLCLLWISEVFMKNVYPGFIEVMPLVFTTSLITGFLFGANFWNVPVCFLLLFLSFIFSSDTSRKRNISIKLPIIYIVFTVICSILLFLPVFLDFHAPGSILPRFVLSNSRTIFSHFLICFFFFIFVAISALYLMLKSNFNKLNQSHQLMWIYGSVIICIFLYCIFQTFLVPFLVLLSVVTYILIDSDIKEKNHNWIWYLFFLAFIILLGCELFYLDDSYGHPYERMNTIFKFHYQVLVLFALACGGVLTLILNRKVSVFFWIILVILFVPTLFYPFAASYAKMDFSRAPELDGMKSYMKEEHPSDFAAIIWLRNNYKSLPVNPVIVEATKDAYSYYSRVSTNTGIPSVLGWGNHEFVWRGNWDIVRLREDDIKLLYETSDINLAMFLIDKYKITNVYWGEMESNTYSSEGLSKFYNIMDLIYNQNGVIIFQVRSDET